MALDLAFIGRWKLHCWKFQWDWGQLGNSIWTGVYLRSVHLEERVEVVAIISRLGCICFHKVDSRLILYTHTQSVWLHKSSCKSLFIFFIHLAVTWFHHTRAVTCLLLYIQLRVFGSDTHYHFHIVCFWAHFQNKSKRLHSLYQLSYLIHFFFYTSCRCSLEGDVTILLHANPYLFFGPYMAIQAVGFLSCNWMAGMHWGKFPPPPPPTGRIFFPLKAGQTVPAPLPRREEPPPPKDI